MSLPTPSSTKPSQSAITSFFQPRQPKYAPPPSQSQSQSQRPSSPDPTPDAQLIAESESRARQEAEAPPASDQPSQPPTNKSAPPPPILLASPSASSALPREAFIRPLTPADIPALKRINSLLLPVAYPEPFYAAALASPFSRAITWSDSASPADAKLVGAIVCRLEPLPGPGSGSDAAHALYIQSLALLSPYRAHGLATAALADLVALAALSKSLRVAHLTAHVWTDNDDGLAWYAARGFSRDPLPIPGYYLKLRPNTAYLVRRDLSPLPVEPASTMGNAQSTPPPPGPSATAAAANLPPFAATAPPAASSASLPLPQTRPPPRAPSSQSQRSGQSFQNKRAETEWNDLPVDMMGAASTLAPPPAGSGTASEASSRSSSAVRKKKERKYAAAAFGS